MIALIFSLIIGLISFTIFSIGYKLFQRRNPEAYIKINFVDYKENNIYDEISLNLNKKKIIKNKKITERSCLINVYNFVQKGVLKGKLIIANQITNKKKEFSIKIYKKSKNVINIKINNDKNDQSEADIIFYINDQKQINLRNDLEYGEYNTIKRKRLLLYNFNKEDIQKIIIDNNINEDIRNIALSQIEENINKSLLINFYISNKKTNILIFIEKEKPLIFPTKQEKKFFINFYNDIYYKRRNGTDIICEICETYKNDLVKDKIIFGQKIKNLEDNKNKNIYFSFINQRFKCLLVNNIISENNLNDYQFIMGYMLLYAYLFKKSNCNYKIYLDNLDYRLIDAKKSKYSYIDQMKIGISFTIFFINNFKYLNLEFIENKSDNSAYKNGFKFFKSIISDLNENSDLTFIYLQIYSSSGLNLINNQQCYKLSMISIEDIKSYIIKNIPKYFFVYSSKQDIYISTERLTQVMCFNEEKLFEFTNKNSTKNNAMNITLGMFHKYGHVEDSSPKYYVNKSFDLIKKLNWIDEIRGITGKFIDYSLFNSYNEAFINMIDNIAF